MRHIMIDIEAIGVTYHAPVVAIGACEFDPDTGNIGKTFYGGIDLDDALRYGKALGSTVKWWLQQDDDARAKICSHEHTAEAVFNGFYTWLNQFDMDRTFVWGNGPSFDITILEYAFTQVIRKTAPWRFWNVRDCRTIKQLAQGLATYTPDREGTAHEALDDARHQAKWVSEYWQVLRGLKQAGPKPEPSPATISMFS